MENTVTLVQTLVKALEQAQLYLDSYDTSAPSRIKAQTNAEVEAALHTARQAALPEWMTAQHTPGEQALLSGEYRWEAPALKPCGVCGDPQCADWDPGDADPEVQSERALNDDRS